MRIYTFGLLAMALVCSRGRAQTPAPAASQAATVPTAPLPENAYRVLKASVEVHRYAYDVQNRAANLAALDAMKRTALPDYSKLRLMRVYSLDNTPLGVAWCIRLTPAEFTYLSYEHAAVTLDRKKAGKIEDADVAAVWEAAVRYTTAWAKEDWHPGDFGSIRIDGPDGVPSYGGVDLLDLAIAAAWLGKNDQASALLEGAMFSHERALVEFIDDGAWPTYSKGIEMLKTGASRAAVVQVFEQAATADDGGGYAEQLRDLTAQLKVQIAEDAARAQKPVPDPGALPVDQQVQFYISQFEDIASPQFSNPGEPMVVNVGAPIMGKITAASDALVKIGRPALPALVALLDDRRITRSVGYQRTWDRHPQVLRYQDVAIKCLEAILDMHFYSPSSSGSFLSNEPKDKHDAVVTDVRTWWKVHGGESEIQGQIARLGAGTIYERIITLHKIEKLDPAAINALQVLRHWAIEVREAKPDPNQPPGRSSGADLVEIADEMALHKNFEILPEMRRLAQDSDWSAMGYLVRWGTTDDFQFLRLRMRQAVAIEMAGLVTDENMVISAIGEPLKTCKSPLAVPVMVECLAYRKRNGLMGTPQGGVNFGIADECMAQLIVLTNHNDGFVFTNPPETRDAAFDRWIAWWKAQGQDAYLATHPEVAKVLASPPASTPTQ